MSCRDRTEFVLKSSAHDYAEMSLKNSARIDDVDAAADSFARLAEGRRPEGNPIYGRLHNDTVSEFELAVAALEHTDDAVGFSSGMAAITATVMAASAGGDHVLAIRPLYGGTDHLLDERVCGIDVRWVTPDEVAATVTDTTALVIAETPANPTLDLVDIQRLCDAAGDTPVLIDSTFATPVLQNPARLGATLVVHSATKYIGGHGDVIGGVVACDEDWAARLRQIRIATGAVLHPMAGYLLRRGLATLPVRMQAAQQTARQLAVRLVEHPEVERVYYPGLNACDPRGLVGTQMAGPAAMIAVDVGERRRARRAMEDVEVITPAVSLGTTDTLIQHPASLTHSLVDDQALKDCAISPGLLRLSVGLEHLEDLWADLDAVLH